MIKINEISLEDCIRLHKEMWMYISEHLDKELDNDSHKSQMNTRHRIKKRYCRKLVEDKIIDNYPKHFCFFCQYEENYNDRYNQCKCCPGIWKTEDQINEYYCECEKDKFSEDFLNWNLSNPKDIANIEIKENLKNN